MDIIRRKWLTTLCGAGAGLLILGCDLKSAKDEDEEKAEKAGKENAGSEVTATEDLMREQGVLRRCLLVYEESHAKWRGNAAEVHPAACQKDVSLLRGSGDEYH